MVSGRNAQFKGTATLNGEPGYYFRVIAQDNGEPGAGRDTFAIKIRFGDPEDEGTLIHSSHNTLAGGNIIVRTKQKAFNNPLLFSVRICVECSYNSKKLTIHICEVIVPSLSPFSVTNGRLAVY